MIKTILLTTTILLTNTFAMQVSPIKIYLNKKQKVQNLNITNNTNKEKTFQNTLLKWDVNEEGVFILKKTTPIEIMSSPIIFKLKPNETKSIKIGKMVIKNNEPENYRIIVKDITPSKKKGISIKMASSIPIFISHEYSNDDKDFIKTVFKQDNENLIISIENKSKIFQEISEIIINDDIVKKLHHYLLPNKKLNIKIKLDNKVEYKKYRLKFLNGIEIKKNII